MYVVISHHYVTKEYLSTGRQALDEMHQEMQHYEGFIERHNLIADDDPLHITSVTYWQNKENALVWDNGEDRTRIRGYSSKCWSKPPQRIGFNPFG